MTVVTEPEVQVPQLVRLGGLLCAWEAEAAAAHAARVAGRPRGAVTGLRTLDRELGGALAVGLHVLHAAPGIGKTSFALQAAASCGCPALFVTCEMSPLELFRRHTARVTNT
ncbi:MAG TPA: DnaB-like helicase C-terminal domain-containing protein, partial [Dehalococcoidia bacterium]|nr:DnaB-like helicase C-terminal domain-containing protein [Dehalococcoidia bacterium]